MSLLQPTLENKISVESHSNKEIFESHFPVGSTFNHCSAEHEVLEITKSLVKALNKETGVIAMHPLYVIIGQKSLIYKNQE